MCPKFCTDAKPYKHTQTLTLRKERDSAVLEGLVQVRDGGEAIPPVVARIFSGDSTSPLTREASVVVRGEAMDVLLRRL